MKIRTLGLLMIIAIGMVSCFEEDQAVPAYTPPANVVSVSFENTVYTHQTYFDLSSDMITGENENSQWELSFECKIEGYQIRINSSNFWGLAHTGSVNFDSIYSEFSILEWNTDKSDGDPDSTAIGHWVDFSSGSPEYSNEVFLIGRFDGISFIPEKKIQFLYVDSVEYRIKVGNIDQIDVDTSYIIKNDHVNYLHFSLENKSSAKLEPDMDEWDLLFSQYHTILFTDDGIRAPYYVRGVLLNPNNVQAELDTIIRFESINYSHAVKMEYSSKLDIIGHDWKSVTVDQASNSAEYKVRPGYTYLIKDANNEYYKLRFKSYFNSLGIKGYPSFEYAKLEQGP